jgi:lipopolysaccharide transport system ATP-binding protein
VVETIIQVENLSKRYTLTHQGGGNRGLRHIVNDFLSAPFRRRKDDSSTEGATEEFWALRDVSFEIKRGEVVGIIGRNGAGKSTLLKILSRITEPTSGQVELTGRVASLLEVGTGFHPELTGRENILLNGAILGMSRAEIRRKFDEIVEFAEVARFLDTPVKRYSSGMYVRLAFAVAAHLEPEILIIDEVLAVGDAQFQKKCLGKMGQVASKEGRTVVFVSHNMAAISALCPKSAYFENGRLITFGETSAAIMRYTAENRVSSYAKDRSSKASWIRKAWIQPRSQKTAVSGVTTIKPGETFDLFVEICVNSGVGVELTASFYDALRRPLWTFRNSAFNNPLLPIGESVRVALTYTLPPLTTTQLIVDLGVGAPGVYPFHDLILDAVTCPILTDYRESYQALDSDFPFSLEPFFQVSHTPSSS